MLNGYKTLIGAAVAFAAEMARLAGVDLGDQAGLINGILVLGGAGLAIYGRIAATKRLSGEPLQ